MALCLVQTWWVCWHTKQWCFSVRVPVVVKVRLCWEGLCLCNRQARGWQRRGDKSYPGKFLPGALSSSAPTLRRCQSSGRSPPLLRLWLHSKTSSHSWLGFLRTLGALRRVLDSVQSKVGRERLGISQVSSGERGRENALRSQEAASHLERLRSLYSETRAGVFQGQLMPKRRLFRTSIQQELARQRVIGGSGVGSDREEEESTLRRLTVRPCLMWIRTLRPWSEVDPPADPSVVPPPSAGVDPTQWPPPHPSPVTVLPDTIYCEEWHGIWTPCSRCKLGAEKGLIRLLMGLLRRGSQRGATLPQADHVGVKKRTPLSSLLKKVGGSEAEKEESAQG